ncbi:unnamed protein product [Cuscuta campestris]|uniref:Pentacotripeptide-repeat region of PRORP domain-containing protein n=1 Tax=Cuscuta campestris TaxID=132261 RepID=A0A484N4Z4_9ASTE|nr:unnamed protein product [Cuscuta campestris]
MSERSCVTWNEMIHGFWRNGDVVMAKLFFDKVPNELRNVVTWTVMVDGYASSGDMDTAREVFEGMPRRNFYAWSSMISGKLWGGFKRMQDEGFEPDEVTMVSALSASAQLASLDVGKEIHEMIIQKGVKLNRFVLNDRNNDRKTDLEIERKSELIFEGMPHKNDAAWNSMISAFAIHGQPKKAIDFFTRMVNSPGVTPNEITFLSVLTVCAHGGFVDEGMKIFYKMETMGLVANIKHYGCLVDLLGRAGKLEEALDLIKVMPLSPNDTVLGSLLGACRTHCNMDMAEHVLEEIKEMNCRSHSCDDVHYVSLSNIYAASEQWEEAEHTRFSLSNKGSEKLPGCSSVMLEVPSSVCFE